MGAADSGVIGVSSCELSGFDLAVLLYFVRAIIHVLSALPVSLPLLFNHILFLKNVVVPDLLHDANLLREIDTFTTFPKPMRESRALMNRLGVQLLVVLAAILANGC